MIDVITKVILYIGIGIVFFLLFLTLFLVIFSVIYLVLFPFVNVIQRSKLKSMKKVNIYNLDRLNFDFTFKFNCESCGKEITTKDEVCPYCNSSYHNNKTYLAIKKKKYEDYLRFLHAQEKELQLEIDNFNKYEKIIAKNSGWFMSNSTFNFDIDCKKHYDRKFIFDFDCEYCGAKLKGSSSRSGVCSSCGASYDNNMEMLALEEREKILDNNNELYKILQQLKLNANNTNYEKDSKFKHRFNKMNWIITLIHRYSLIILVILAIIEVILIIMSGGFQNFYYNL